MKKKIDIAKLPDLDTRVGLHASVKQQEVGGGVCLLCFAVAVFYGAV